MALNMNIEEEVFTTCPGTPQQFLESPTKESSSSSNSDDHIVIPMEDMKFAETHVIDVTPQTPEEQEEEVADGEKGQCRLCHEEDLISLLESPCACNGTLKYAHRRCIHRWCNMKGDITCEICRQPYVPNYTVVDPLNGVIGPAVEIRERWTIPGTNTQVQSPVVMADRASERVTAALNQDCDFRNPTRGVLFGILFSVLLVGIFIRDYVEHSKSASPTKEEDASDASHSAVCIMLISIGPFIFLSCLYEVYCFFAEYLHDRGRERRADRNRTAE